ncbi:MAG TPA: hypothetical protein VII49_13235 [Rhizomicrobium sp.]
MTADVKITTDALTLPMEEYEPAPTIFIDGMQGITATGGVIKINCFQIYAGADNETKRRIVLRLACPVGLLPGMQAAFGKMLESLKTTGAIGEQPNAKH